jgi:hypothetical protein
MSSSLQTLLAEKYYVDDLPGAALVGARLNGILQKIEAGDTLTTLAQSFLATNHLLALQAFTSGQIDLGIFETHGAREREARIQKAQKRAVDAMAERTRKAEASAVAMKAHFAAMANDPILRRKREAKELRGRFGIGFVESEHLRRVMSLLRQVSNRQRLRPEDVAWLSTEASSCWTEALQRAWHQLEAEALSKSWGNNGDPWDAVNASGHWRKADKADMALAITEAALLKAGTKPKLRSALATTRGGAMRDLRRLADAKTLAMDAHNLTPSDFRPCTLLGAVHIELGALEEGLKWYEKAETFGAKRHAIDQELQVLLVRSDPIERQRIGAFLIGQDPVRFAWARK